MAVSLFIHLEKWPIAGKFAISRGAKTTAEVVVAELADGRHRGSRGGAGLRADRGRERGLESAKPSGKSRRLRRGRRDAGRAAAARRGGSMPRRIPARHSDLRR